MNKKWLLKGLLFSIACMAVIGLIYSPTFGQISQDISYGWSTPINSYIYDSSSFLSPLLQTSSYGTTFTNPFAATSSQGTYYSDLFSTAGNQSFTYSNVFGFSLSSGSNMYRDPYFGTGGEYFNVVAPGTMFSHEYDYTQSVVGGSTHFENSLTLPWTHYSSEINTAYGMNAYPFYEGYSGASVAFGMPTIFSLAGREAEGVLNLVAFAPVAGQMDRVLGDTLMYTAEGMPFYATASYFNPANASNYYFAPGAQMSGGGIGPGYGGSYYVGSPYAGGGYSTGYFSGGGGGINTAATSLAAIMSGLGY